MEHTDAASLVKGSSWWLFGSDSRRLCLEGRLTDTFLRGDEISVQFVLGDRYLIVTHYDHFDYANHWFHVVDRSGTVIDMLSTPAYFGFVEQICMEGDDRISLGFYGTNDRWTFTLHDDGFRDFGLAALLRRLNRFFLSKRHLSAHRTKGKKWVPAGTAGSNGIEGT